MTKKITSLIFLLVGLAQLSWATLPTPLLTAPQDSSSGNPANTLVNWYNVAGATSYEYKIGTNPSLDSAAIQSATSSQFSCSDLLFGITYYWQVRALKTTGIADSSDWTQIFRFTTLSELNATAPANAAINQFPRTLLNWSSTSGITQYEVQVNESAVFLGTALLDSLLPDSISECYTSNLEFGKTYYWRVRTMHALDTSNWTSAYSFTVTDSIQLSAPTNNSAFLSTGVLLNWDYISGVSNYEVQVDKTTTFNSPDLLTAQLPDSNSQWTPGNLEFGTNYYWRVRAWHASDTSSWSQVWTFSTLVELTLSAPGNNSLNQAPNVTLNWNYLTAPISYDCEFDTSSNFNSPLYFYTSNDTISEFTTSNLLFGTTYYWRARAHNAVDTSQWSSVWKFSTIDYLNQTAPANGASNLASRVTLNWSAVSGLTGYEVRVDTLPDYSSPIAIYLNATTSSQQITNLYFGTTYYWSIRAHHSADTSSWTNNWFFNTTDFVSLSSPLNNSTGATPRTNLNWATLSGSTSYLIQFDTSATFSSPIMVEAQTNVSNYFTSNLYFNQVYYWRVKAINLVDTSAWSSIWSFTTLNLLQHTSPLDGAINQALATQLNWTGVSGAVGYLYRYDTSPTFSVSPQIGNSVGTNSRANIVFPLYGQTYYWQVAVFDSVDTSGWSNPWSFTTLYQIAATPNLLAPADSAQSLPNSAVAFSWNQVPSATGYELSYSTSPLFVNAVNLSTTDTFGLSGLLNYYTSYYWRVRASNGLGYSAWSTVFTFTTENPLTVSPLLLSPANSSSNLDSPVNFVWSSIALATSYECEYSSDSLFSASTTLIISDTTTVSQALLPLSTYYWRVRGTLGNASSPWSAIWKFNTKNPFTSAPQLVSPFNGNQVPPGPVNFVWNALSPSSSYECEYDVDSLFSSPVTLIANDTSISSLGLANYTKYFWRVRGIFHSANSPWSSVWSFVTQDNFVPTLIYPLNADTGIVSPLFFKWAAVSGATSYECQYSADSLFTNPISLSSTSDSAQSLNLASFTKYYWRVRALDGAQTFSWSEIWNFTSSVMIGVHQTTNNQTWMVYPNPSTGRIVITTKNIERGTQKLEMYNSEGSLVYSCPINSSSNSTFDFSSLEKGIYYLKILTQDSVLIQKLVLQ